LKEQGAVRVVAYCTHPVLSGRRSSRIEKSTIDELVVTDTIPLKPEAEACGEDPRRERRGADGRDDAQDL
jgi:ribose-phosphate pyrophosphokinase